MTAPTSTTAASPAVFTGLIDLVAERLGGRALATNDEWFAGKENLLRSGRGDWRDEYTERGKWMDGWETRRRRHLVGDGSDHDRCVVRLAIPGDIRGVDVDTQHFLGNFPAYAAIDACAAPGLDDTSSLEDLDALPWREIVERTALGPGRQNLMIASSLDAPVTHARLRIFPDGGVSRLRLWGVPRPTLDDQTEVDCASILHGGRVVAASDMFFGDANQMLWPGRPVNMGEGWETRRRRGPGHDWAIVRLAGPTRVSRLSLDTCHFKGNAPEGCWVEGCLANQPVTQLDHDRYEWQTLLERRPLKPHHEHHFDDLCDDLSDNSVDGLDAPGVVDHVRLSIYPDGGVGRLRVWGRGA